MKASDYCINKIKEFEGLRLNAYQCSAGVWTIGYGHTSGVHKGDTITKVQAEKYLQSDLEGFEKYVSGLNLHINQNQFDALVDFAFNLGKATLGSSTLLKKIKAGASSAEIQKEFKRWVYAGGKIAKGLVTRRNWEAEMWDKDWTLDLSS